MLRKSAEAMLAGVEIYNKPRFNYREESFAILCINAWELLLKARILHLSSNKLSSLYVYERFKKKDGAQSKKKKIARNRSGSPKTLGLLPSYLKLVSEFGEKLDKNIRVNLIGMTEVRDNSVHFYHKNFELRKRVHELGSANIKNYLILVKEWFGEDFTDYDFFLMPLAFINPESKRFDAVKSSSDEKLAIEFFNNLESGKENTRYSVMLNIEVGLSKRGKSSGFDLVKVTNDPSAKRITISDAEFKERYPWSFQILTRRLKSMIPEFKQNAEYHSIRKKFEANPALCKKRLLDPDNPKSTGQNWYNPDIAKQIKDEYSQKNK